MERKTPLYKWHEANGGKIVPFAGYLLPVQYETGLIAEHCAVREKAGLFDVSHMGEFAIYGKGALDTIQRLFTNDFTKMNVGRVRYTLMCNEEGGIIDDLVVYKGKRRRVDKESSRRRSFRGYFRLFRPDSAPGAGLRFHPGLHFGNRSPKVLFVH